MESKSILKIFLIITLIIAILNCSHADSGPTIGPNQAKKIAQNYLNSHNLPYTAITPVDDDWQIKVNDTKTGKMKWIPFMTWKSQFATPDGITYPSGNERYIEIYDVPTVWIIQVTDKNEKNVGQIYVNDETGKILKVIINDKVLKDIIPQGNQTYEDLYASTNSTNTTNTTIQTSQKTDNNTGLILGIFIITLAIIGAGYWKFNGR